MSKPSEESYEGNGRIVGALGKTVLAAPIAAIGGAGIGSLVAGKEAREFASEVGKRFSQVAKEAGPHVARAQLPLIKNDILKGLSEEAQALVKSGSVTGNKVAGGVGATVLAVGAISGWRDAARGRKQHNALVDERDAAVAENGSLKKAWAEKVAAPTESHGQKAELDAVKPVVAER